jgi:hypothetical protein
MSEVRGILKKDVSAAEEKSKQYPLTCCDG